MRLISDLQSLQLAASCRLSSCACSLKHKTFAQVLLFAEDEFSEIFWEKRGVDFAALANPQAIASSNALRLAGRLSSRRAAGWGLLRWIVPFASLPRPVR
jgi:hypothetical protein